MKRGVKQKFCKYLLFLNFFGGIGFFALYPYYSQEVKPTISDLFYGTLVENTLNAKPVRKNTLLFGNSTDKHLVRVLLWTDYFQEHPLSALHIGEYGMYQMTDCPVHCEFTSDRGRLGLSDAVVFHSRDMKSTDFPRGHPHDQIWIYLNQESPANTRGDLKDFTNVFNWTMTYKRDSDIYHPYGEVVLISQNLRNKIQPVNRGTTSSSIETDNSSNIKYFNSIKRHKSKLVAWVVSNCNTQSRREGLVAQLKQYVPVDVFGDCGDLHCRKDGEEGCFPEIEKKYKFYLSFENSLCKEYVTEKLFSILNRFIVPIIYGADNHSITAPPGSYINARDFNTTENLAKYLLYLDTNLEEYLKYFRWKKYYKVIPGTGWCSLCTKLSQRDMTESKWYTNLWRWWNFNSDYNVINYQINFDRQSIQNIQNDMTSGYSGDKVTSYLTEVSENTYNLTPMCLKPPTYPDESVFSKLLRKLRKILMIDNL